MCPSSLQVDTIACVHIESMPSFYTPVQTATAGRLHLVCRVWLWKIPSISRADCYALLYTWRSPHGRCKETSKVTRSRDSISGQPQCRQIHCWTRCCKHEVRTAQRRCYCNRRLLGI